MKHTFKSHLVGTTVTWTIESEVPNNFDDAWQGVVGGKNTSWLGTWGCTGLQSTN